MDLISAAKNEHVERHIFVNTGICDIICIQGWDS